MSEYIHVKHNFGPIYNNESEILILGSFPSVKSREADFYYAHPQNRFWKILARVFGEETPKDKEEKINFVLRNKIALYDVIEECDIIGSSDSSIKNEVPVDILKILEETKIDKIYCNGATSYKLYEKMLLPKTNIEAIKLPSTSPANAAWNEEKLFAEWKKIMKGT